MGDFVFIPVFSRGVEDKRIYELAFFYVVMNLFVSQLFVTNEFVTT